MVKRLSSLPGLYALWLVATLASIFWLDRPISDWIEQSGLARSIKGDWWADTLKWPGTYWFALWIAFFVFLVDRSRVALILSLIFSGIGPLTNMVWKWTVGRMRPMTGSGPWDFDLFRGGWTGFFKQGNLSLGSGHAAACVGTMTVLAIWFPKYKIAFFSLAWIVAIERVMENAHYLGDSIAGIGIGYFTIQFIRPIGRALRLELSCPPVEVTNICPEGSRIMSEGPYLSLVIPCYNEEESVPTLLSRVESSLNQIGRPYEVIIIDDGSTDKTPELLAAAKVEKPWLRVLRMQKNTGQSGAFEAGFAAAKGELIATIDADLQNDPEEIPRLVKMIEEQKVDMITGWRKDRQDTNFRKWQSRKANQIRNWISQETVNDSASSLKLYRAYTLKGLKLFNGAHRFFPTLVKMRGYTCFETPVKHSQRFAGTAKYGFRNRAFRAFIDLLAIRWMKSRYLRYEAKET